MSSVVTAGEPAAHGHHPRLGPRSVGGPRILGSGDGRRIRQDAAEGGAPSPHRGHARARADVRPGRPQSGRAPLRRRRRPAARLPVLRPAVVPRHLLPGRGRAPHRPRTSPTWRRRTCAGPTSKASVTSRCSSIPRPTRAGRALRRRGGRAAGCHRRGRGVAGHVGRADHVLPPRPAAGRSHGDAGAGIAPCRRHRRGRARLVGDRLSAVAVRRGLPGGGGGGVHPGRPRRRGGAARVRLGGDRHAGGASDRPRGTGDGGPGWCAVSSPTASR